ncbi:phage holin family protein [Dysgonomonas macrotermitis]|uniref:Putative Holin-X, holin superfamily III n=1 Tax=Dysgonomonas macrotermitis TaxID=1346286 RepID=A0A1M5G2E0_9BACT|nr:phage holin family protein [Dysgonomonas macrotermitis]SHF97582.1 Putative Holin-X, holin superfamily III [Dysgonomonas macrotermitis]
MKIDNNEKNEYQDFTELIDESKADLSSYIDKRLTLAKLKAYEKGASATSYIIYSLIIAVFILILFALFLFGLALLIGEALHNYSAGFGVLILIILAMLGLTFLFRRPLRRFFVNMTVRTIKKIEDDED